MSGARRHRRVVRPATGGVPQTGGVPEQTSDDVDPKPAPQPSTRGGSGAAEDEHSRWLREQRPPHWE
ncbi:hypothetical protein ACMYYO_12900 [Dermacoccaceae bacterium W4C1]